VTEDPSVPSADPAQDLDALLERVAAALSRSGGGDTCEGFDADGVVQATVTADGRVAWLEVDPRILRNTALVAPAIVDAVNSALAARPAGAGRAATLAELKAIQQDSLTVTRDVNASMLTSLEALKRR